MIPHLKKQRKEAWRDEKTITICKVSQSFNRRAKGRRMLEPIKYSEFREVAKNLIKEHYETEVPESEMKVFESKLIEYASKENYGIYVKIYNIFFKRKGFLNYEA